MQAASAPAIHHLLDHHTLHQHLQNHHQGQGQQNSRQPQQGTEAELRHQGHGWQKIHGFAQQQGRQQKRFQVLKNQAVDQNGDRQLW